MATATCELNEDQFNCSVCMEMFLDPVTLPCGHNFCKICITQYWSSYTTCNCPICRSHFPNRPELKINTCFADVVEQFRQSLLLEVVLCDECIVRAKKSCSICLMSYCESHLEPHLKSFGLRNHPLVEPQKGLTERFCRIHNTPKKMYCPKDQQNICVMCKDAYHKGHGVIPLKKASENQKKELVKTEKRVQNQITIRMKKIEELRSSVKISDTYASRNITDGTKALNSLKESVEKSLSHLIRDLIEINKETQKQGDGLIQELEQEIRALQQSEDQVKMLLALDDPASLMKHASQLRPEPTSKDWDNITVSEPAYEEAVERAMSELEQNLSQKILSLVKPKRSATIKDFNIMIATPSPSRKDKPTGIWRKSLGTAFMKKNKKILTNSEISTPQEFQHLAHIPWDPTTGIGLRPSTQKN